jgi:hypothetical protein
MNCGNIRDRSNTQSVSSVDICGVDISGVVLRKGDTNERTPHNKSDKHATKEA